MHDAVTLRGLDKRYVDRAGGAKHALKAIDLTVPRGSFFALLGANGAGKSTLINILAGLVLKTSGEAQICGYDIERDMRRARQSIGVVPQELVLDTFFTVREALDMQAGYYGVSKAQRRTQEIMDALGLADKADVNSRRLSGGMRRRLLVAKALVHAPSVLILDEPTAGVDVELRAQLWEYVRGLHAQGTTVLLTTHYLEEAEMLCDRIAVLHQGEVVVCEDKEPLLARFDRKELVITPVEPIHAIPECLAGWDVTLDGGRLVIRYQPSKTRLQELLHVLMAGGIALHDLSTREARLEDVFRQWTTQKVAA